MAVDGIKINTRLDNSQIPKDLQQLNAMVSKGGSEVTAEFANKVERLNATWGKLEAQQERNNNAIQRYKNELEEIEIAMRTTTSGAQQEKLTIEAAKFTDQLTIAEARAQSINVAMGKVGVDADKLAGGTERASVGMDKTEKSSRKLNTNMGGSVKSLMRYAGALVGVRSLYLGLRKAMNAWTSSTVEGQQASADLQHIWVQLGSALAPIFLFMIKSLQTILGYANAIFQALFGVSLFAKSTAKATGGIASGLSSANKEAKKLHKQLSGFDEMNVLSEDGSVGNVGGGGGGGIGGLTPTDIGTPNLDGFKQAIDKMKEWLDSVWNSDAVQSMFESITTIFRNKIELLKGIGLNVWDNLVLSWDEMFPFLQEGMANLVEYWRLVLEDVANFTTEWYPIFLAGINQFVDNVFNTFRPLLTFIAQLWRDFTGIMLELWQKYGEPLLDEFGRFIESTIAIFNKIWTSIIDPIIAPAIEMLNDLWDNHIKDLLKDFGSLVAELIIGALKIYNQVFAPIVNAILDFLAPAVKWLAQNVFPLLGSYLGAVADRISIIINTIRGVFQGLLNFINGVFTGNWAQAWQGIVNIFSSVFGGIQSMFKTPMNFIIRQINSVFRSFNRLKVPSWVPFIGGRGFSFSPIPQLAKGGITTGATTAVIGEAGREAVVPLENNTGWAKDFLGVLDQYGGMGGNGTVIIPINLDGKEIARHTIDITKQRELQLNRGVI